MKVRKLLTKINDAVRPPHVRGPGGGGGSPDAVDDARTAGVGRPGAFAPPVNYRPVDYDTKSDE